MAINFERLVSRDLARRISVELDLAGVKSSVNRMLGNAIVGALVLLIAVSFMLVLFVHLESLIAFAIGVGFAGFYLAFIYIFLEFLIDRRRTAMETMLPDYLQITSANLRSGIALDRAMLLAARPEFTFFAEDIKDMSRRVYGGETLANALKGLQPKYRSYQLNHTVRMITESLRYGGAMADLLEQISKDLRDQQIIQKEVASQLFMYSIFIAFAGVIAAPVLYALTGQMISVTTNVWKGITLSSNVLSTSTVSFLRPTPPQIGVTTYRYFSITAIIIITGFAAAIMSAISTGSAIRGLRYLPVFILGGLGIYLIVARLILGFFAGITPAG